MTIDDAAIGEGKLFFDCLLNLMKENNYEGISHIYTCPTGNPVRAMELRIPSNLVVMCVSKVYIYTRTRYH